MYVEIILIFFSYVLKQGFCYEFEISKFFLIVTRSAWNVKIHFTLCVACSILNSMHYNALPYFELSCSKQKVNFVIYVTDVGSLGSD